MTEAEAKLLVMRMVVIWGDFRVADAAARALYVREFLDAFRGFKASSLDEAISVLKRTERHWPAISLLATTVAEGMPKAGLRSFKAEIDPILTPEEIERRKVAVAAMKEAAAKLPKVGPIDPIAAALDGIEREPKPAAKCDLEAERESIARMNKIWKRNEGR